MIDETLAPDAEITPAPAPESTTVTQEPTADPAAAASDCVTSSAPEPTPEATPESSPVQTLAPPADSLPPEVDQDPAMDEVLGLLQSIDAALTSDELSTDELSTDEIPVDEPAAVEPVAPYDVPAVELAPGDLAIIDAVGGVSRELIAIGDQLSEAQLHDERPLLTTPFEDYTVSEGLLLLLLLCIFVSACFRLLRGGFRWLRS